MILLVMMVGMDDKDDQEDEIIFEFMFGFVKIFVKFDENNV